MNRQNPRSKIKVSGKDRGHTVGDSPVLFVPCQSGLPFLGNGPTLKIKQKSNVRVIGEVKVQDLINSCPFRSMTIGHPTDSPAFRSLTMMTIGPSIPEIQFVKNSKSRVKVNGTILSDQLTHFLSVSYQGILLTPVPFVPWQSGLPITKYNFTLKIQGQKTRSKLP